MSETTTTESPEQRDADTEALGEAGNKALAIEREARKAAEEKLAEFSGMTKAEVRAFITEARDNRERLKGLDEAQAALKEAQDAASKAVEDAAKAATDALRWKTVAQHKIDVEDAEVFITGSDEESITRQAERLAGLATKADPGPTTPKPDATQGATGEPAATSTGAQFAAAVESAFN